MYKPDSLRAALTAAIPELTADPDKLAMYIDQGRIAARAAPGLGFEWRYRLQCVLTDFVGAPDAVAIATILWLRDHQPDLLLNHKAGNEAIAFEADIVDATTIDLALELQLTEAVTLTPRASGGWLAEHLPEPKLDESFAEVPPETLLGEIYVGDELIVRAG